MKKVIVTTTINPVTPAIEKFQDLPDWELIVVGDKKTPADYPLRRGLYLPPAAQEAYDRELSDAIGWNCVQRRNFGLLYAHDMKADIVAVVDDDNIPYDFWGQNLFVGGDVEVNLYSTGLPAFDPLGATNETRLWQRGYPLQLLARRDYSVKKKATVRCDIQADLWNGDPDVDAVCRMIYAPQCRFDDSCFPIASDAPIPFGSQNTFIGGGLLKDYFLFPHIGRMDDIWAGYYAQARGYRVVCAKPSVRQERNVHDPAADMKMEYLGYEKNLELLLALRKSPENIFDFLPETSARACALYREHF